MKSLSRFRSVYLSLLVILRVGPAGAQAAATHWWPDSVEQALSQAGTNRDELVAALDHAPESQRAGMQFLVENMPAPDLRTLSSRFLLDHVAFAYDAFAQAPWHGRVPQDIFLNDVLPYACISEVRDVWGPDLRSKSAPLVADCKTPAEAAQRLNEQLFKLVNVKYSTARRRADQSPLETMKSGIATCTGLSILLVDACRAVGVPARVVGVPLWSDDRGNHTWVEIWDGGWHFVGAAEPDPKGLDHSWFEHDASLARGDDPRHAIFASSFRKTGVSYPLGWVVSAVNVTERYTAGVAVAPPDTVRLLVKVFDHLGGKRVAATITVNAITNPAVSFHGISKDESADLNEALPFAVPRGLTYDIRAEYGGEIAARAFTAGTNGTSTVVLSMSETTAYSIPPQYRVPAPGPQAALKPADAARLKAALTDFFSAAPERQTSWKFPSALERLLRNNEAAVREIAWEAYRAAPIHDAAGADFATNAVRFQDYLSPYTVKTVGTRPANGWALFIAMHGGGNTPKEVNDSQWRVMQRYYRDHPEAGGYRYVALRAPNDTWNGFYDVYVYPLVDNLIRQFTLFGDVDPDKVFIMGYSHGGYGAFAIGPKEPDLFAAIHASAGAPTDGETTGRTLRNTVFTCMVGENDTAFGRIERDRKFKSSIDGFRGGRPDIYPVTVKIIPGNGHTGLPDRDMIREMYPAVRNPVPRELTWRMTDQVITDFFWLRADQPAKEEELDATCRDNQIVVTATTNTLSARVLLDGRLIDFSKPITLEFNGNIRRVRVQPHLLTLCQTLQRRGDPELSFTAEIPIVSPK